VRFIHPTPGISIVILHNRFNQKRKGAATVEMALVAVVFFMMLFGIFEYCRFLFLLHVANNAARDTARFACVKTSGGNMVGDPLNISQSDIEGLALTGKLNGVQVTSGMCGFENNLTGFAVSAFTVDNSAYYNATTTAVAQSASSWNSAAFSQKIAVRISGTYTPIAPGLLLVPTSIPFSVTAMAFSEAN